MSVLAQRKKTPAILFWVALAFLVLVAFTGGSSRSDVQSLVILRPVAILVCALAFITLRRSHMVAHKGMFIGFGAMIALTLVHLIPLPPVIWHQLPGRQELAQVDMISGLGPIWRPLTLTPTNGWHALSSLFVPLAMMLLAVQIDLEDLHRFAPVILVLGALSGLLGLLQVVGGGGAALYLYRGTNDGTAAGLFANRNHAALFLAILFPILATWSVADKNHRMKSWLRIWSSIAAGVVLFPMILVTGSRSGLLLSIFGLIAAVAIFVAAFRERSRTRTNLRSLGIFAAGLAGVVLLGFLTLRLSKADAIVRLVSTSRDSEFRFDIWRVSLELFWKYFPFGSGAGSFVEAYQIIEPAYQLNANYRNHAHQDVLEIGLVFGLPGLVLLFVAIASYFRNVYAVWFQRPADTIAVKIARMATVAIGMIVIASLVDYPLRTPFMMCIFTILWLWSVEPARAQRSTGYVRSVAKAEN